MIWTCFRNSLCELKRFGTFGNLKNLAMLLEEIRGNLTGHGLAVSLAMGQTLFEPIHGYKWTQQNRSYIN